MAVESLHRYFDYAMGRGSAGPAGEAGLAGAPKTYFQYAQLHKSVLYADFECWAESVEALGECICTGEFVFTTIHIALLCCPQLRHKPFKPASPFEFFHVRNISHALTTSTQTQLVRTKTLLA